MINAKLPSTKSKNIYKNILFSCLRLKEAPKNPNTSSPYYQSNAKCAYHSDSAGHVTNNCWALKNKIQDLIDAKEVEFDALEKPNVISAPMPKH